MAISKVIIIWAAPCISYQLENINTIWRARWESRTNLVFKPSLLDFHVWDMGPHVKQLFSEPRIIRSTFSKTPNNRTFWTEMNLWGHINIGSPKISATLNFKPPKSTFGDSKFQTPNNLTYLKFQIQNKHMSIPSSQSWLPLPFPPLPLPLPPRVLTTLETSYLHHPCQDSKPGCPHRL